MPAMDKTRRFFGSSFGSAILGGAVVAVLGAIAVSAGWIDGGGSGGGSASLAPAAPLTRTASDRSKGLTVKQIYQRDQDGVVFIRSQITQRTSTPFDPFPQEQKSTATGSGFVIDNDGHIVTNNHVVQGASKVEVSLGDDKFVPADVVGQDASTDLAVLKVNPSDISLHPLPLGDSGQVSVGDPVVAIGNPFALDRTVTSGIVSALQRQIQAPNGFSIDNVIQTDAAINPGNSGGPLIDAGGRVIGINSQIASQSGGSEGIGFAEPINTARDVIKQLLDNGSVQRAYLGITGADITPEIAKALNLPVDKGAIVEQAFQGGPAADAGIRGASGQATIQGQSFPVGGDIIVAIDGQAVSGMEDVIKVVDQHKPGDKVTVTVVQGGSRKDVQVELGDRPATIQGAGATTQP
jgi:S1-C subfamily serine protease